MLFEKEQQEVVLDKMMDVPNINEENVFNELVKVNNESTCRLSAYGLSIMWNNTDAVKFSFINGRTANDFMQKQ